MWSPPAPPFTAWAGGVEHAAADKPTVHGLMAAAAAGDHADLAHHGSVGAHDNLVLEVHPQQVRMRGRQASELLADDILRSIDQLFHPGHLLVDSGGSNAPTCGVFTVRRRPTGIVYHRTGADERTAC